MSLLSLVEAETENIAENTYKVETGSDILNVSEVASVQSSPEVLFGETQLPLSVIRIDGGTQPREGLNNAYAAELAEQVRLGAKPPPITVFFDGANYWLADGFHRFKAYEELGSSTALANVQQGTQRDAILFSVGANASHGLRRTNADKRRAIMRLLTDSEWSLWSDREIAKRCRVDHKTVSKLRQAVTGEIPSKETLQSESVIGQSKSRSLTGEIPSKETLQSRNDTGEIPSEMQPQVANARTYINKHGKVSTMNTANIGGNQGRTEAQEPDECIPCTAQSSDGEDSPLAFLKTGTDCIPWDSSRDHPSPAVPFNLKGDKSPTPRQVHAPCAEQLECIRIRLQRLAEEEHKIEGRTDDDKIKQIRIKQTIGLVRRELKRLCDSLAPSPA